MALQTEALKTNLKTKISILLTSMDTEDARKRNPTDAIEYYAQELAALLTTEIEAFIKSGEVTFVTGQVTGTTSCSAGAGSIAACQATGGKIS